jgi:hypothetical protein
LTKIELKFGKLQMGYNMLFSVLLKGLGIFFKKNGSNKNRETDILYIYPLKVFYGTFS